MAAFLLAEFGEPSLKGSGMFKDEHRCPRHTALAKQVGDRHDILQQQWAKSINMHSNASHTVDGAQWFSPTKAELFHVLSGKTVVCFMGVG